MFTNFFSFACIFLAEVIPLRGELWEKELTSAMTIGLSRSGYKSVDLRCDRDHFSVNVTLEDDFRGVVYTRGSFNDKKLPCFKRHDQRSSSEDEKFLMGLRIPFHKCRTVMDVAESRYTNVLVIQHDTDLIMPGDAAFSLSCAFVPEFRDNPEIDYKEPPFKSKIILVDADPSAEETGNKPDDLNVAFSKSEKVTFLPDLTALQVRPVSPWVPKLLVLQQPGLHVGRGSRRQRSCVPALQQTTKMEGLSISFMLLIQPFLLQNMQYIIITKITFPSGFISKSHKNLLLIQEYFM